MLLRPDAACHPVPSDPLFLAVQAMTPPEYGLEEFVEGVEALDKPDDVIKVRFE